ncbi:malate synthase A [Nocardioides sp. AN3]
MTMELTAPAEGRSRDILTPEALDFVLALHRGFATTRSQLLRARALRREEVARTGRLDFLAETAQVRSSEWTVAPIPADLCDRRVEITGPTSRKMTINALNSGAKVWLADLEDANTPHWANVLDGQVNLYDAVRDQLAFTSPEGKRYTVTRADVPVTVVRPRGWHLDEVHLRIDGRAAVGALVDFGLHFFHNATELVAGGTAPYYYLPKMESHLEARLWNDIFGFAERTLGVAPGTIRATVLIETIPAAFEMDEILYELRDHVAGLNAGRWDYLFSIIKYFRDCGAQFVLPDRGLITMDAPLMRAYTDLLVKTCHRRGAMAIGGMAAFIPNRRDPDVNRVAFAKVREDKEREARAGFDGSWVAHPDLVPLCAEVFTCALGDAPNQLDRRRGEVDVTAADLLDVASIPGAVTVEGLRGNVEVALRYLEAWLRGNGAVGIHHLMEDAATAEISRAQVWQWRHNQTKLDDGSIVTNALVRALLEEQLAQHQDRLGTAYAESRFDDAARLFAEVALADEFPDFLTVPGYAMVAHG